MPFSGLRYMFKTPRWQNVQQIGEILDGLLEESLEIFLVDRTTSDFCKEAKIRSL